MVAQGHGVSLEYLRARIDYFILSILALSLSLNIYLLTKRSGAASVGVGRASQSALVDSVDLKNAYGMTVKVHLRNQGPTILYILSPDCRWCKYNEPRINALAEKLGKSYRVIGISLAGQVDTHVGD